MDFDNRPVIPCPCCGYLTIGDTYDGCVVCLWEHDPAQADDPDYPSGAIRTSLREAQRNFESYGSCEPDGPPPRRARGIRTRSELAAPR